MLTELCVFHNANAFKDIISATKDFVAKNETRPLYQMVFLRGQKHAPYTLADQVYHRGQLTAIALGQQPYPNLLIWTGLVRGIS